MLIKKITSKNFLKFLFAVYIVALIKVIIFKYPFEQLQAIANTWQKGVILEGLGTANFVPFHTIKMYIDYAYKLNSVENLAGNILAFVPFGVLFPMVFKDGEKFLNNPLLRFISDKKLSIMNITQDSYHK